MKKQFIFLLVAAIGLVSCAHNSVDPGSKEVARVEAAIRVLEGIMGIRERFIPPSLLGKAYGFAVIPRTITGGFIVGGRHGRGILVVRHKESGWSNPSFIVLYGGGIGLQIGAQSSDLILVFRSSKSIDAIMKTESTLGAKASIAAGPVGRHVEVGTDLEFKAEIYSYSRSRGMFAGVSLEGATLEIDDRANEAFYGEEGIAARDIFTRKGILVPAVANRFKQVLAEYVATATED
ncbi:MAG: hypothetical protein GTO13_20745 [Proteobacteria bacterium]|nr:hypothetical protein [Pseudomonadota bacterium]